MAILPKSIVQRLAGEFPVIRPVLPHLNELNVLLARDRPYVAHMDRWEDIGRALRHTARLLWGESIRVPIRPGVTHVRQIMAMTVVVDRLLHPEKSKRPKTGSAEYHDVARQRLARWFWCATFANYGPKTTDGVYEEATRRILPWVASKEVEVPEVVRATTAPSVAELEGIRYGKGQWKYRAVLALLARQDPRDLLTGERLEVEERFETRIQGHHLFPKGWATRHADQSTLSRIDGIANIAPLTAYTNVWIRDRAPDDYLARIRALGTSDRRIDELLRDHLIDPQLFRSSRFDEFYEHRLAAIHLLVATAVTGGPGPMLRAAAT